MPADRRLPVHVCAVLALSLGAGLALAALALLLGAPLRRPGTHWRTPPGVLGWAGGGGIGLLAFAVRRRVRRARSGLVATLAVTSGACGVGLPVLAFAFRPDLPGPGVLVLLAAGVPLVVAGAKLWQRSDPEEDPDSPMDLEGLLGFILIVVAGLLAIGLPSTFAATQRVRQRRTLLSIRDLQVAVEGYATDHGSYPAARSMDELALLVTPVYVRVFPREDGWGWPIDYRRLGAGRDQHFYIRSPGADGLLEHASPADYEGGPVEGVERDIVFTTGRRPQFPEGTMGP